MYAHLSAEIGITWEFPFPKIRWLLHSKLAGIKKSSKKP